MTARNDDAAARYDETERVAGVGSFDYRPQEDLTIWSPNLYRIYGLDPARDELLEFDAFRERVHRDDRGVLDDMLADVLSGEPYGADMRFRRFDGVERVLRIRGESRLDADGNLERAHGTTQDVTEARATEAELRESRRRMVEAMRVAGVGSFEGRPDTREFEWSEELRVMYGLDPAGPASSVREYLDRMVAETPELLRPDPPLGPFEFEHEVTRADGALRRYEVRGEVYRADGVSWVRGTVRDVTAVRRGEAQQAAVATLTRRALEGVPLEELLPLACELAASALSAEAVGAVELRPDGTFEVLAAHGVPAEMVGGDAPEVAVVLARQALEQDAPARVADWRTERADHRPAAVGELEVLSSIAVPIRTVDRPFGALGAATVAPERFGDDSTDFLVAMANVLAAAIERAAHERQIEALAEERGRLVAQTLEAEERMRRRVSEAIHDGALQDLLAARQDLVEAQDEGDEARELLERGRVGIERAVAGLRQAVHDLHPVVLQHAGLEAAVAAAADNAARAGGFTPTVRVAAEAGGAHDDLVLSLSRELLTNVAKHARADEVTVAVSLQDESVVLEVADDGVGIEPGRLAEAPRQGHIGLASLAERVEAIGGRLDIEPGPTGGTTVRARLPAPR